MTELVLSGSSLLSLAKAAVELSDGPAAGSLRKVLLPRDYTRLDDLTALITNVINEAQQTSQDQAEADEVELVQTIDKKPEINNINGQSLTDLLRSSMVLSSIESLGKLEKLRLGRRLNSSQRAGRFISFWHLKDIQTPISTFGTPFNTPGKKFGNKKVAA